MKIILNGEEYLLKGSVSVETLIGDLKLDTRKIAIERNLVIVPRSAYSSTNFSEGDRVEIVAFIGGG